MPPPRTDLGTNFKLPYFPPGEVLRGATESGYSLACLLGAETGLFFSSQCRQIGSPLLSRDGVRGGVTPSGKPVTLCSSQTDLVQILAVPLLAL